MMQTTIETTPSARGTSDLDENITKQLLALAKRLHEIDPAKLRELIDIVEDVVEANEMLQGNPWAKRMGGVLQA